MEITLTTWGQAAVIGGWVQISFVLAITFKRRHTPARPHDSTGQRRSTANCFNMLIHINSRPHFRRASWRQWQQQQRPFQQDLSGTMLLQLRTNKIIFTTCVCRHFFVLRLCGKVSHCCDRWLMFYNFYFLCFAFCVFYLLCTHSLGTAAVIDTH